mgnify:CR=1 FL=1
MTKRHIYHFIFVFIISFGDAFAQNDYVYWQPKIIDLSTSAHLETANISINRKTDYPINTQGTANIPLGKINEGDSIFISCMGYKTFIFQVQNKKDILNTIELTPVSYDLKEVEISKRKNKFKETIIGTKAFSISTVSLRYNSSYGFYINNNDRNSAYIKEVSIRMFDRYNGIDMPFKLRLYKKTPNEPFPKEELVEPMVVQNTKKKKWFSIDISHLAIKLPENGFFIVFEVLGKEYYNDKKVKVFGTLADELPSFGFTTFPKDINKENYSIIKLDDKKWFLNSKNTEYQFQAKIVEIQ